MPLMPQVTYVLSRPLIAETVARARAMLTEHGVLLSVVHQGQDLDWEAFAADQVELADAIYFDVTRDFAGFDTILDAAMSVPLVVPGGRAAQAEWPHLDRNALTTVRKSLLSGRPENLAEGALWLLSHAGRWHRSGASALAPMALAE